MATNKRPMTLAEFVTRFATGALHYCGEHMAVCAISENVRQILGGGWRRADEGGRDGYGRSQPSGPETGGGNAG